MNAGNVGCSWPRKCRCLRKETLTPVQSSVVPTQTALPCCWMQQRALTVWKLTTIKQLGPELLLYSVLCIAAFKVVLQLFVADVIFPPQCCSRPPRGPLHDMSRSACRSWNWLLSFLEHCQVQLHPPQASPSARTSSSSQLTISVLSAMLSLCLGWLWPCTEIKAHSALLTCLILYTESQQQVIKLNTIPPSHAAWSRHAEH